ncbi:SUMF1/EgtB/PvdO family nonheme iron enzyme [Sorangium sp. So ce269]
MPAGSFNRFNDADYPATVSDFRLDTYEVTVGRFRRFVDVYAQDMIGAGSGKNPNNPLDTGWDVTWNAKLPEDKSRLIELITQCSLVYSTWAGEDDKRPMNCITWYEAAAFCAWDGGRLPTEAEWSYAAVGGDEQRLFPWGGTQPGPNADLAVYNCLYGSNGCDLDSIAPVGSVPAGKGRWGHFDLAGNVAEWGLDANGPFPVPCTDCAYLEPKLNRVQNGGNWFSVLSSLFLSKHYNYTSTIHDSYIGVRCARAP